MDEKTDDVPSAELPFLLDERISILEMNARIQAKHISDTETSVMLGIATDILIMISLMIVIGKVAKINATIS